MIRFEEIPEVLSSLICGEVPRDWPSGEIVSVEQDSRRIRRPGLYVCIHGIRADGRSFIEDAKGRGAQAVVGGSSPAGSLPYLEVRDPRKAIGLLSAIHARHPSRELEVVGITGTNGKTTTSWILQSIWERCGVASAVLGTLGSGRPAALSAASHTTPDAPRFQSLLRSLADGGYRAVAAEISSHALDQDRIYGTRFRAAVFTNLTRDHLDYHGTFDAYRDAKRKLFHPQGRGEPSQTLAVVNLDDPVTSELIRDTPDRVIGYGTSDACDIRLTSINATADGIDLEVATPGGSRSFSTPMIGAYNGWNVLAAYAAAFAVGLPADDVETALAGGIEVPGRTEAVRKGQPFLVLIDYAHTPDALSRILNALKPLTRGKLIVLFGCGGDRDAGKRPEMGMIAASLADRVVLTNDNPRSEDQDAIISAILAGVRSQGRDAEIIEPDRSAAILAALRMAKDDDIVLIAGKGHEDYQETASGKTHFSDREVVLSGLETLGWEQ